jgi:large exoprotein involved in heme utilization and adhesion
VSTFGSGNGGNLTVNASSLVQLVGTSADGRFATALLAIAEKSFIFGVLSENSDIVANAFQGRGGTITAKARGIFGFRRFIDRRTPESDFTASSDLGIDGSVEINTQDQLEVPLPGNIIDRTQQIDQRCTSAGRKQGRNSFTYTRQGGLPPNPNDPLMNDEVKVDWVTLENREGNRQSGGAIANLTTSTPQQLVEAQGWVIGADGRVILTASAPTVTPQSPGIGYPSCEDNQATTE